MILIAQQQLQRVLAGRQRHGRLSLALAEMDQLVVGGQRRVQVHRRIGVNQQTIQRRLESTLAALDGGKAALVFASGVAAGAAYLQALPTGTHILFSDDLFYGFRALAPEFLPRWGITWSEVDMTDLAAVRRAVRPETRLIWAETPTNPLMKVLNIVGLANLARDVGAQLLIDSTFPTPALLRPLSLGS